MHPRAAERTFEPLDRAFDPFCCRSIDSLDAALPSCRDMSGGHNFDLLGDIVEDQHRVGKQEGKIRKVERILLPRS